MLEGRPEGSSRRVAVIQSMFNEAITSRLCDGALAALHSAGVAESDLVLCRVPGAFELPLIAQELAGSGEFDAVVALGAVIRGDTDHYDYVCAAAQQGALRAAMDTGVPVMFGVLTCDTEEQAVARSGGPWGSLTDSNKGADVALDALRMADLLARLRESDREAAAAKLADGASS